MDEYEMRQLALSLAVEACGNDPMAVADYAEWFLEFLREGEMPDDAKAPHRRTKAQTQLEAVS